MRGQQTQTVDRTTRSSTHKLDNKRGQQANKTNKEWHSHPGKQRQQERGQQAENGIMNSSSHTLVSRDRARNRSENSEQDRINEE